MYGLRRLAERINATARSKGWWFGEEVTGRDDRGEFTVTVPRSPGTVLALVHSEVSEALEEWRDGNSLDNIHWTFKTKPDSKGQVEFADGRMFLIAPDLGRWPLTMPGDMALLREFGVDAKPEGVPIELSDVIIRVLDACHEWGIDIDQAMKIKMDYNEHRPHRHGGKRA